MGIAVSLVEIGHLGVNQYGQTWERGINNVGGASVKFNWQNKGDKTIKYIKFYMEPFNAVGDAVGCTISGLSEKIGNCTGPYTAGSNNQAVFENMWYNQSIVSASITKAEIQYMDGTEETIQKSDFEPFTGTTTSGGCYVATAVYGSYDCPQVWTLRRYRDYTLAETHRGRAFIKAYYAVSPTLVRWFGDTRWFKAMWRGKLDRLVKRLQAEGVKSTPYNDRVWK